MPFLNVDIFDDLPLRLRNTVNPYVKRLAEARTEESIPLMFGSHLRGMRGRWREHFSEKMGKPVQKLILEIGVHKGKVIQSLSQDHPNHGIIGMDITMKRVVISAQCIQNDGSKNGVVVLGNAKYLNQLFAPNELDGVLIFFPDPWNKKKHQLSKRLMDLEFCKQVQSALNDDGFFWVKTDCSNYFEETVSHFTALGFERTGINPFGKAYESVFEGRFKNKNQHTFEETLRKRSQGLRSGQVP